jgi:hypothetical protein
LHTAFYCSISEYPSIEFTSQRSHRIDKIVNRHKTKKAKRLSIMKSSSRLPSRQAVNIPCNHLQTAATRIALWFVQTFIYDSNPARLAQHRKL